MSKTKIRLFDFRGTREETDKREDRAQHGKYYINITPKKLSEEIRIYLDLCSEDKEEYPFSEFINWLFVERKYTVIEKEKEKEIIEVEY